MAETLHQVFSEMNINASSIDEPHIWKILRSKFDNGNKNLIEHQLSSFNEFIERGIQKIIDEENEINVSPEKGKIYKVNFGDIYIPNACTIDEKRKIVPITPNQARMRDMTYESPLQVDITESIIDQKTNKVIESFFHRRITIAHIPIMLNSCRCNLTSLTKEEQIKKGECYKDPGGYFIVNGKERVLIAQIRNAHNNVLVTPPRKIQLSSKFKLAAEIRSMSDETGHSVLIQALIGHDNRTIVFNFPNIGIIPVGIIFKAFGYTSTKDIIELINIKIENKISESESDSDSDSDSESESENETDEDNFMYKKEQNKTLRKIRELLSYILRDSYVCQTEDDAIKYISEMAAQAIPVESKFKFTKELINTKLLPHLGISATTKEKVMFLGYIVNKLLRTYLKFREEDDIDNYSNKRFETTGILFTELFRNLFKQYTKTLAGQLQRRPKILDNIEKFTRITTSFRHSMSTGNWGPQKNAYIRTGVSQVKNRLSYASGLSYLRRVAIPTGKEAKNTKIRQIHLSSFGYVCPADCFAPDTPILMWDGTIKRADQIKVGDYLIDDKGNSTEVYKTTSGTAQMYEIRPKGATPHTVTYNHILTLKIKKHNKCRTKRGKFEVMFFDKKELVYRYRTFETKEEAESFQESLDDNIIDIRLERYLNLPESVRKSMYCFYSDGVNWEKQQVDLDPYILGMWLGDGLSVGTGFSTADKELLEYWEKWSEDNNASVTHYHRYQYGIASIKNIKTRNNTERNPLKKMLEKYNLINNKHIPKQYLVNDRETRLKVLAGLVDTDGSVRRDGHEIRIQQCLKNKRILDDAMFLAKSLGFKCNMNETKSSWTLNGVRKTEKYFELTITGTKLYEIPTILPRKKLQKFTIPHSETRVKGHMEVPFEVIKKDITNFVGWQLKGSGRFLLPDFITSHNTPEGKMVGIVLNMALLTKITRRVPFYIARDSIKNSENFIDIQDIDINESCDYTKIFLNGTIIGFTEDPEDFEEQIKEYKRSDVFDENVSVVYIKSDNEIQVFCDEGRIIRAVFPVNKDNGKLYLEKEDGTNWVDLVSKNKIVYIDPSEAQMSNISMWPRNVNKIHNYCEIHPSMILSVCSSTIPYPDHSQAPRNCYQSSMSKQAMGIPYMSYNVRADTITQVMQTPQKALVQTKPANFMGFDDMPSGQVAVVAIMLYTGGNQEDSILIKKQSIERGLFAADSYKTHKADEDPTKNNITYLIQTPTGEGVKRNGINYSYLGNVPFDENIFKTNDDQIIRVRNKNIDGVIKEGVRVKKGDAIIGRIMIERTKGEEVKRKDCSVVIKSGEEGVVDKVFITKTQKGQKLVKVVIRQQKIPEIGDKFAARSAQKGTCILGDSLVSLQSGNSCKIKDLKVGEKVWGLHENNGLKPSVCTNKQYMGHKETLKITLINGDSLICTKDHRIMTKNGWIEAQNLSLEEKIMTNLKFTEDIKYSDEINWNLKMSYKTSFGDNILELNMKNNYERKRSLAFARILGLTISDGWICGYKNRPNDYRGGVSIGNNIDSNIFIEDIKTLLKDCKYANGKPVTCKDKARFYESKSFAGSCFVYDFPAFLSRCIASLDDMPLGKTILQEPTLPTFLYNSPKSIIREFLGGLFGGDGTAPYITNNEIRSMEFKWKCVESKLEKSINMMKTIQNMLESLGVKSSFSKPISRESKAKDGEKRYSYGLNLFRSSEFLNNIGFRYCLSKQCKLESASSFWKSRSYLSGNPEGIFKHCKEQSSKTWLTESESYHFFEKGNHIIKRYDDTIPYFYTKIDKIEDNGICPVYDITVKDVHSFIANGMVIHNCGGIIPDEDMPFNPMTGMSPDLIINSHCLTGDTIVTLENGDVDYIKNIYNKPQNILTVDPKTLENSYTNFENGFVKPANELLKIKTISNRILKCTPEHLWLVIRNNTPQWIKTENIIPYSDKLIVKHSIIPVKENNGELLHIAFEESNKYVKRLKDLNLCGLIPNFKTKILARFMGALESDGHIRNRNENTGSTRCFFHLGETEDINELNLDCKKLGFNDCYVNKQLNCFRVEVEPALAYLLKKLGACLGHKAKNERVFPNWILKSSSSVKREFLSGYQGGDGSKIACNFKFPQQQVHCKGIRCRSYNNVLDSHIKYLENLQNLFTEFNIETSIQQYKAKEDDRTDLILYFSTKKENVIQLSNIIDYKYCNHKRRESRIPIEFLKSGMNNFKISYEHFKNCFVFKDEVCTFVESIEKIHSEQVYDFTTISSNHSFIANSIVSHNCIPSRMTINQLQEMVLGKACCFDGEIGDCTPFGENSVDAAHKICDRLKKWGFEKSGTEKLINGMTGQMIEADIYMGPTYYQRLKHIVGDKIHARAHGNVTMLYRQPLEGRSRDGGKLLPLWCLKALQVHVIMGYICKLRGILVWWF